MKKLSIMLVSTISLIIVLSGCIRTNDVKEKTRETLKVETKVENEKVVIDNFIKVLNSKDSLKAKEFLLDNIKKVNKQNADKMVMDFEKLLIANFEQLSNKCISGKYKIIIEEAKKLDGSLDFEKVKNEEYRREVKSIISSGYVLKMGEGDYYLYIDYEMINDKFSEYLSPKLKPYYELRKRELNKPTFIGEYVNVDFKEVKERAVILENFINDNKDFNNKDDLKLLMTRYTLGLLSIDYISKTLNSDTGKVDEIVKSTYADIKESNLIIVKQAVMAMDSLLEKYNYVIKPNDKEALKKINELKSMIGDQVAKKIEEFYRWQVLVKFCLLFLVLLEQKESSFKRDG